MKENLKIMMILCKKKEQTKLEREETAKQRFIERLGRKEESSEKKKETKKKRGDERNIKLFQKFNVSQDRREERYLTSKSERINRLERDNDFHNIRNERRRNHLYLNYQNTWKEEVIGTVTQEIIFPERIKIEQVRK